METMVHLEIRLQQWPEEGLKMDRKTSYLIGRLGALFGAFFLIREEDRDWTSLALQVVPTPHQLRVAPKKRPHQVSLVGFSVGNDFCRSVGLPFDLVFAVAAVNAQRLGVEVSQAHSFVARGINIFIAELIRNNAPAKGASDLPKQYAKYTHTRMRKSACSSSTSD